MKKKQFYYNLFSVLGLLLFFSCSYTQNGERKEKIKLVGAIINDSSIVGIAQDKTDVAKGGMQLVSGRIDAIKQVQFASDVDTGSLSHFWKAFQKNIRIGNKNGIIEVLDFPIHAIFFTTFQFSYDCDTLKFIQNEKKYLDIDIDRDNIKLHFDFIFSKFFKKMILSTSAKDLMKKRLKSSENEVIYPFFVRDYFPNGNCYLDHRIYFYFQQIAGRWRISISGE